MRDLGTIQIKGNVPSTYGFLPNETVIVNYKNDIDIRPQIKDLIMVGMKALTSESGGAGTEGYAMVPIAVDPRIIDQSRKFTPLRELFPRVTNIGMTADYNLVSSKGAAHTGTEDPALAEEDDDIDRASTGIKFLRAIGRVTGVSIAAYPSYLLEGVSSTGSSPVAGSFGAGSAPNAKQLAVLLRARALMELEENLIINGNKTTSGITGNPDGTEFDGIIQLMSTTNTVAKGTTAMGLGDIDTAIQYAFDDGGRPNLAACSSAVYTDLLALLTAKIGYLQPSKEVFWGFSTIVLHTMVGEIPVIPSMFMSNTTAEKAIYFLDLDVVEMRVLQDMTYQDLAKNSDSEKFFLKIYECLIIKNTAFCSSITGISA